MPPFTPAVQALLLINVAAFALDALLGGWLNAVFALWPIGSHFLPFQPVTYAFLHGNMPHLVFNMLGLWMFGSELETVRGSKRFLIFYFVSVLTAAALQLLLSPLFGSSAPTLGASGGIFGLLVGFAMTNPNRQVMLLIPPIPMKAKTMAIVYGALELYLSLPSWVPGVGPMNYLFGNVAHFAHLGGMLGGWLMIRYWRGQPPFGKRR
jgi:membrane associated rhomboid family serine protease